MLRNCFIFNIWTLVNVWKYEKQEEEIVEIDVTETSTNGELKTENERDLSVFSMEELIQEMHILSVNNNILSVSKKVEEVRTIFYHLRQIIYTNG